MTTASHPGLDREWAQARYGPWVVIAGGSDGTGEAYARQLAELGLNILLVARRQAVLETLAAELRDQHGVETRVLVQDLMAPEAAENMLKASADLDVGLYISNAGIDGTGAKFFEQPVDRWRRMINMNVVTVTEAVHGFGNRLLRRGHGGLLIMCSGSGLGGTPFLSMYSATKGFEILLTEALWGELSQSDIDVLGVVAPAMDTPFFRRSIAGQDFKLGGLIFTADHVAREALAKLGHQPLIMFPTARRPPPEQVLEARFEELQHSLEAGRSFFPKGEKEE